MRLCEYGHFNNSNLIYTSIQRFCKDNYVIIRSAIRRKKRAPLYYFRHIQLGKLNKLKSLIGTHESDMICVKDCRKNVNSSRTSKAALFRTRPENE